LQHITSLTGKLPLVQPASGINGINKAPKPLRIFSGLELSMTMFTMPRALATAGAGLLLATTMPALALAVQHIPVLKRTAAHSVAPAQHGQAVSWANYEAGQRAAYAEPAHTGAQVWRGRDGRDYCRKPDGTVGMIVGGAAGALLGREVDRGYNRTLGTILGAAGGALLGRAVDRNNSSCR
jgi:Glycine zipper 2TM domain